MIKISSIWANKSKAGETFFSGNLGGARLVILKNSFKKEGSNEPDFNLYIDEPLKKPEPKSDNTFDD